MPRPPNWPGGKPPGPIYPPKKNPPAKSPTADYRPAVLAMVDDLTNPKVATVYINNTLPPDDGYSIPSSLGVTFKAAPATWVSTTTYNPGDLVSVNAVAYQCIAANTNSQPPNVNWTIPTGIAFYNDPTLLDGGSWLTVDTVNKVIVSVSQGESNAPPTNPSDLFQYIRHSGAYNTTGNFQNPGPIDKSQLSGLPGGAGFSVSGISLSNYQVGPSTFTVQLNATLTFVNGATIADWLKDLDVTYTYNGGASGNHGQYGNGGQLAARLSPGSVTISGATVTIANNITLPTGSALDLHLWVNALNGTSAVAQTDPLTTVPSQTFTSSSLPKMPAGATISVSSVTETIYEAGMHTLLSPAVGYSPGIEVGFDLGESNTPPATQWGYQFVGYIRQHGTTSLERVVQAPVASSSLTNNSPMVVRFPHVTPGYSYDSFVTLMDGQGNETPQVALFSNYAVPKVASGFPVGPIWGRPHMLPVTTDPTNGVWDAAGNKFDHANAMSTGVQALVNSDGSNNATDIQSFKELPPTDPNAGLWFSSAHTFVWDKSATPMNMAIAPFVYECTFKAKSAGDDWGLLFCSNEATQASAPSSAYWIYLRTGGTTNYVGLRAYKYTGGASAEIGTEVALTAQPVSSEHHLKVVAYADSAGTHLWAQLDDSTPWTYLDPTASAPYTSGYVGLNATTGLYIRSISWSHSLATATNIVGGTANQTLAPGGDGSHLQPGIIYGRHMSGAATTDTGALFTPAGEMIYTRHDPAIQSRIGSDKTLHVDGTTGPVSGEMPFANHDPSVQGTLQTTLNGPSYLKSSAVGSLHLDTGTGTNQVSTDTVPDGTTYQRVKATELSTGFVKQLNDGTNIRTAGVIAAVIDSASNILNVEFPGGKLQADGSITNVDGVASHDALAFNSTTANLVHLSAKITSAGGAGPGLLFGTLTNGYRLIQASVSTFGVIRYTNGAGAELGLFAFTLDSNPHTMSLIISFGASSNTIEAIIDTTSEIVTDSAPPSITSPAAASVYTGGSTGSLRNFDFSVGHSGYLGLPPSVRGVVNSDGSAAQTVDWLPDGTTRAGVKVTELAGSAGVYTVAQLTSGATTRTVGNIASIVDGSGNIPSSSAWKANVPNSLANLVSNITAQCYSASSGSLTIYFTSTVATSTSPGGTNYPDWEYPDGSGGVYPGHLNGYSTVNGTSSTVSAKYIDSGGTVYSMSWTSLPSTGVYILIGYNKTLDYFTVPYGPSGTFPTDAQIALAQGDGSIIVTLVSASSSTKIATGGAGGQPVGGGGGSVRHA